MEATITLVYDDEKTAEAVAKAVSPDNLKKPACLTIETTRKHNAVTTNLKVEGKMATFIATIDDLLFSVSVAEKTLEAVRQK